MCDGRGINQDSYCQKLLDIGEYRTWGTLNIKHKSILCVQLCTFTEVQMREAK